MEELLKLFQEFIKEDTTTESKKDTDKADKETNTDRIAELMAEMFSKAKKHNCSDCKIKKTCVSPKSGNTADFVSFGSAVTTVLVKNICTKEPEVISALTGDFIGNLQKITSAAFKSIAEIKAIETKEQKEDAFDIIVSSMELLFQAAWVLSRLIK